MWFDDLDDVVRVVAVGLAAYVTLVVALRVSGKRTLAKLNAFDLVVTVAFGSVLATALLDGAASLAEVATAFVVLAGAQVVVAALAVRVRPVGRLVRAEPTALVVRGQVDRSRLVAQRVSMADLRAVVRRAGLSSVGDALVVVLETDGSLSVVPSDAGPGDALDDVRGWRPAEGGAGDEPFARAARGKGHTVRPTAGSTSREGPVHVRDMLRTYPRDFNVDLELLARTVQALEDCANTCSQCADACLSEQDLAPLAKCIRLNLDCADVCQATARILSRQTEYDANVTRPVLEACIAACRSCGDECAGHAEHMDHCRVCADVCRACEQACSELLDAMR